MSYEPAYERTHPTGEGVQKVYKFDNGYGASVVRFSILGMPGSYGYENGLWELGVVEITPTSDAPDRDFGWSLTYDTPISSDVLGHLTEAEVEEKLAEIEALPARQTVDA